MINGVAKKVTQKLPIAAITMRKVTKMLRSFGSAERLGKIAESGVFTTV